MSPNLPEHASYEYLKKLAKERLALLRARNPATKLAEAQLAIAREYGFSSWRALKAEMDLRRAPYVAAFMRACATGDVETLRELLQRDTSLACERLAGGTTALQGAPAPCCGTCLAWCRGRIRGPIRRRPLYPLLRRAAVQHPRYQRPGADLLAAGMACAERRVDYSSVTGRYERGVFRDSSTGMAHPRSERPPSQLWWARSYLSFPQDGVGRMVFGMAAAVSLSRLMANSLYGVSAADPLTKSSVLDFLVVTSLNACGVPGWRASKDSGR